MPIKTVVKCDHPGCEQEDFITFDKGSDTYADVLNFIMDGGWAILVPDKDNGETVAGTLCPEHANDK